MALTVSITASASDYSTIFRVQSRIRELKLTSGAHGFESLVCIYVCDIAEAFEIYDRAGLPHVAVTDNGATIWEGRLEDVAIVDGGVRLAAFGYQRALSDTLYTATHTAANSSDIAAALVADVAATNSTQLSTSTALISTNALSVTETYNDMRPAEILSRLAGYGDTSGNLWEWGVYDQRALYFRQRGSAGRAWYVDATSLQLERSIDKLYNSVYATYTNGTNTTNRTAASTSSESVARYGITREAAVNSDKKDATIAAYQRDTFLADNKDATPRAQIAFDSVYDASGGKWPLYMVRAGDSITIRNLPPTISSTVDKIRTFYVARTNYSADDDVLTVEPSAFTPTIDNQIGAGNGSAQGGADPLTYVDTNNAVTFASINVGSATGAGSGFVRVPSGAGGVDFGTDGFNAIYRFNNSTKGTAGNYLRIDAYSGISFGTSESGGQQTERLGINGATGAVTVAQGLLLGSASSAPAGGIALQDGITAPSATSGAAKIYVDTADGDLKIIFGDGTVKTIATDT